MNDHLAKASISFAVDEEKFGSFQELLGQRKREVVSASVDSWLSRLHIWVLFAQWVFTISFVSQIGVNKAKSRFQNGGECLVYGVVVALHEVISGSSDGTRSTAVNR